MLYFTFKEKMKREDKHTFKQTYIYLNIVFTVQSS